MIKIRTIRFDEGNFKLKYLNYQGQEVDLDEVKPMANLLTQVIVWLKLDAQFSTSIESVYKVTKSDRNVAKMNLVLDTLILDPIRGFMYQVVRYSGNDTYYKLKYRWGTNTLVGDVETITDGSI